jgi:hypothetical protein
MKPLICPWRAYTSGFQTYFSQEETPQIFFSLMTFNDVLFIPKWE